MFYQSLIYHWQRKIYQQLPMVYYWFLLAMICGGKLLNTLLLQISHYYQCNILQLNFVILKTRESIHAEEIFLCQLSFFCFKVGWASLQIASQLASKIFYLSSSYIRYLAHKFYLLLSSNIKHQCTEGNEPIVKVSNSQKRLKQLVRVFRYFSAASLPQLCHQPAVSYQHMENCCLYNNLPLRLLFFQSSSLPVFYFLQGDQQQIQNHKKTIFFPPVGTPFPNVVFQWCMCYKEWHTQDSTTSYRAVIRFVQGGTPTIPTTANRSQHHLAILNHHSNRCIFDKNNSNITLKI